VYLRENGNSTALLRYLEPYIREGFLDFGFKDGPKHPTQTNWFNECGMRASPLFSWMVFVDIDEFIVVLHKCAEGVEGAARVSTPRNALCAVRARQRLARRPTRLHSLSPLHPTPTSLTSPHAS